ncbi:MAG: hypothetical protein AB7V46_24760 [Thermomicrobiales bacterium]
MTTEKPDPTTEMLDNALAQSERSAPEAAESAAESAGDNNGAAPTQDNAAGTGDAATARSEQQQKPGKQPTGTKAAPPKLRQDGKGNLIDETGAVVARAGADRREFERIRNENARYARELPQLQGELNAFRTTHAYAAELGVPATDIPKAVQLLAAYRKNPAEAIKLLVTQARAAGINVELDGSSIDPAAMRAAIREETAPIREAAQARQAQQQAAQLAAQEVQTVFSEFPQAAANEATLLRLVAGEQKKHAENANYRMKSLRELFLEVKAFAAEHRLDLNRDVFTQIAELAQKHAQQQQQQSNTDGGPATRGGIPTGRGTANGGAPRRPIAGSGPMKLGTSAEDRARAALREHGIPVNF